MEPRPGGDVIRAARKRAHVTQAELARLMGTGQSVIARWERGVRSPAYETVVRAVQLCGFEFQAAIRRPDDAAPHRSAIERILQLSPEERLAVIGAEGRKMLELEDARR